MSDSGKPRTSGRGAVTPEIVAMFADQPLISDQLRIIAGERNGLKDGDRQILRAGAELIDDMLQRYQKMRDTIVEANGRLIAQAEVLHDRDAKIRALLEAKRAAAFPALSMSLGPQHVRFG